MPVHRIGKLVWRRPEAVSSFLLEGGANIFVIACRDGTRAMAVLAAPGNMRKVTRVVRERFRNIRVINTASPQTLYDGELAAALMAAGPPFNVICSLDRNSWCRAIVKMALGLACQTFGAEFTTSASAHRLRRFMREGDPQRGEALELRGRGGPLDSEPRITKWIHPGGGEHLFALIPSGRRIMFVANLFGEHENAVVVDESGTYLERLPEDPTDVVPGMAWIVEPSKKVTQSPVPIASLIRIDR